MASVTVDQTITTPSATASGTVRARRLSRLASFVLIVGSCLAIDQATKVWATAYLSNIDPLSFAADTFRLQYALNPGGFLGLGGTLDDSIRTVVFVGINAVGLGVLLAYLCLARRISLLTFIGCTLILAGGVGNQIDRMFLGGLVIDFLNVGLGPIRSGIFNVADMAISCGALLWVYASWTDDGHCAGHQTPSS
jgi:signal peptidase II